MKHSKAGVNRQSMFFSIIVPVYNCSALLEDAMEMLLQLRKEGTEIILIDDGSSDDSYSICEGFCRQHERMIAVTQTNAGPSAARNRGLRMAKGDYVAFFDVDDIIDTTLLLRLLEYVRSHREFDVWCTDFYRVDSFGRICDKVVQIREQPVPIFDSDYLHDFLGAPDRYWNVWRYVFKRSFLLENDLFFLEGYHIAEDLEYMTRVFLLDGQFAFFHNPYYFYVVEQVGTLTGRYDIRRITQLLDILTISKSTIDHLSGHPGASEMARKIRLEYVMCLALISVLPREQQGEARRAFQDTLFLLDPPNEPMTAAVAAACRTFGVWPIARMLYRVKRLRRKYRQASRGRKYEAAPKGVTCVLARRRKAFAAR